MPGGLPVRVRVLALCRRSAVITALQRLDATVESFYTTMQFITHTLGQGLDGTQWSIFVRAHLALRLVQRALLWGL
tara:strand:- start:481 stop:708 length:228 start_codon:yes stop_codon:yes gene_type:complete